MGRLMAMGRMVWAASGGRLGLVEPRGGHVGLAREGPLPVVRVNPSMVGAGPYTECLRRSGEEEEKCPKQDQGRMPKAEDTHTGRFVPR
jgi:hypothetical protein